MASRRLITSLHWKGRPSRSLCLLLPLFHLYKSKRSKNGPRALQDPGRRWSAVIQLQERQLSSWSWRTGASLSLPVLWCQWEHQAVHKPDRYGEALFISFLCFVVGPIQPVTNLRRQASLLLYAALHPQSPRKSSASAVWSQSPRSLLELLFSTQGRDQHLCTRKPTQWSLQTNQPHHRWSAKQSRNQSSCPPRHQLLWLSNRVLKGCVACKIAHLNSLACLCSVYIPSML